MLVMWTDNPPFLLPRPAHLYHLLSLAHAGIQIPFSPPPASLVSFLAVLGTDAPSFCVPKQKTVQALFHPRSPLLEVLGKGWKPVIVRGREEFKKKKNVVFHLSSPKAQACLLLIPSFIHVTHSPSEGDLSCFLLLAIINKAALLVCSGCLGLGGL